MTTFTSDELTITPDQLKVLEDRWGKQRVFDTMIFLEHQVDHRGILCPIEVTAIRVEAVHQAILEKL